MSAASLPSWQMLVGGRWCDAAGGQWVESYDPFTGQPWAHIPRGGPRDAQAAVAAAAAAFTDPAWAGLTATQRGRLLQRLAELIERDAEALARLEVQDNGKLYSEMLTQLKYLPQWFRYYGGLADKVEGRVPPIDRPGMLAFTQYEPLGVVVAITPWNSPLLLAAWKLAPALAAGNTVVWKPSEHASVSSLAFARLFEEAGFPPGVVNVVTGFGGEIGDALTHHPDVAKVAFTGGDAGGKRVYAAAAGSLKTVTLELGGKSPNIVFADADLQAAANGVVAGIFAASGQTCLAGSRLLVQRQVGDPMDAGTQVGPVTTRAQFDKILGDIEQARAEGAQVALGGAAARRPECGQGWFVEPTIFTGVRSDMRIAQEEVFGPVLSVIPFDDEADAVRIANDTRYGLAAGVWTGDIGRAVRMSRAIRAGTVWINTYRVVSYMAPFGGYKQSGIGRESGIEAIHQYLQVKSVWINAGAPAANPFVMR
jgi:(Z)-2-((N-methylformamido)methylene)-5-hydroxybutyrolactone dehydrogenase